MAGVMERGREAGVAARRWLAGLSVGWLVVLALVTAGAVSAGGVFMYRTYSYVEHDNQFCLSCHLMVDPYERFAQSAHRDLGCKACHQPTFVERSRMAVSQVLENPDEITTHAHVPNSVCASCHIDGDPEQWRIISRSIGHRIHLESDDPALRGLMCVECHSTSIHEFATSNRTCGQSGCHEDTRIVLGRMEPLTIHCVACHEFSRPSDTALAADVGQARMQPGRNECLTCHQMRVLVADMPEDEPHDRVCGACHNPHDQATPREAERTCASAGCHVRPDTLTPMHQGLAVGVLENCLGCHTAHDFRVQGDRCLDCHQDIFQDDPRPVGPAAATQRPSSDGGAGALSNLWSAVTVRFASTAPARVDLQAQQARRDPLVFSHARHRDVECSACHSTERVHGAVTVTSVRDCQSCHHTAPVANRCEACHQPAELRTAQQTVRQAVRLSVAPQQRMRNLPFSHAVHAGETCASCHREPLTMRVTVSCNGCHEQHHRPNSQCISCHVRPPADAHTVNAHLGCAGAGCHDPAPAQVRNVPRTRNLSLGCHQDLVQHEPGGNCADCHRLPAPRPSVAAPAGAAVARGGG
jgi:hypothetical protein